MKLLMESWRSYLSEDWRTETDWEKGEDKRTLGDVDDYLGDETDDINVSELSQQIPSLPTRGAERVNDAEFGEYKIDDETGEEKWVWFPIIVVKSGGQYRYVLDGNHRLQKAIDQKVKNIKAKILDLDNPETPEIFVRMFGGTELHKAEKNISYSGVVLDDESKQKLLDLSIPEGWEPVAHHMTITMGPLVHKKGKHDFSEAYSVGQEIDLPVISVGQDDRAMAVKVGAPSEISKKISFPHITVAVNRQGGGKPHHSNKIPEENFEILDGLTLRGVVEEVPQSS